MKHYLAAILWLGSSYTSFAGIYDLNFRRVAPSKDSAICQTFIENTATVFAAQSDALVIDYGCQQEEFSKDWNAILTYQSPTRLKVTSTHTLSIYSTAFYSDRTQCEAQLPFQSELFKTATGLEPLAVYCMLDVGISPLWETRVDGLGEPALQPTITSVGYWGALVDSAAVIANYKAAIKGYGFILSELGNYYTGIDRKIVMRLYVPESYRIEDYNEMKYSTVEQCSAAAAQANANLKSADHPVVAFCEKELHSNLSTLHVTAFEKILKPKSVFAVKALPTQYSTFSACQTNAEKIASASPDIFAAICAGRDADFHIHLFSRP